MQQLVIEYAKLGRDIILVPVNTLLSEEKETIVYDFLNTTFKDFYTKDPYIIYVRRLDNMWCINGIGKKLKISNMQELFNMARL